MKSQGSDTKNYLSQAKPKLTHLNRGTCLELLIQPIQDCKEISLLICLLRILQGGEIPCFPQDESESRGYGLLQQTDSLVRPPSASLPFWFILAPGLRVHNPSWCLVLSMEMAAQLLNCFKIFLFLKQRGDLDCVPEYLQCGKFKLRSQQGFQRLSREKRMGEIFIILYKFYFKTVFQMYSV